MIRSILIGFVAGSRAMTPLAALSGAARKGRLDVDEARSPVTRAGAPAWLGSWWAAGATRLLAAGELAGDKMKSAPDRITPAGLFARIVVGAVAGAALAPRRAIAAGAVLGAAAAVAGAYLTFALRVRAMRRWGQTTTGLVEDGLTMAATNAILADVGRGRPSQQVRG